MALLAAPEPIRSEELPEPELRVSGYGFFGNRELKRVLELLEAPDAKRPYYDAQFVEDSILILMSRLNQDGYLKPRVTVRMMLANGTILERVWDEPLEEPLPRGTRAQRVEIQIDEGVLYHYGELEFVGLEEMSVEEARGFFIERGALLPLKSTRIYNPARLKRGLGSLVEVMQRKGYQSAKATATEVRQNDETGEVDVSIQVEPGSKSIVRSVNQHVVLGEATNSPSALPTISTNEPYSQFWLQDFTQQLKNDYYERGYPDTTVDITTVGEETIDGVILLDLLATVSTGPQIVVGEVLFTGHERTQLSVIDRRVEVAEGELLNRVEAERGRFHLARLGVFESVELSYEPVDEHVRNVIYRLNEGKVIDVNLIFGFGSYELLRAGVELEQFNVFGRAHHSRLKLIQSFRSSTADYDYTMPELFGENVDVFLNASALRREEVSFTREEFGGGAGARRYFEGIFTDVSVRYNYQVLHAAEADVEEGLRTADVGALITDIRHDRRDNPLYPRAGYKLFSNIELATEYLAGNANYQRLEFAGSYHQPLDVGRWLHFGVSHGVVLAVGSREDDLPFNRRFFPGGENSVRGFQQGEAAPRNERGRIVGAETYLGGTIEFEQALTPAWSIVAFTDAISFARRVTDYPGDEVLVSAGAGIRWRTLIGPVRLEYGHNVNPRAGDPSGTVHFSIGFPF